MKLVIFLVFLLSGCCNTTNPPISNGIKAVDKQKKSVISPKKANRAVVAKRKASISTTATLVKMSDLFSSSGWKRIGKYQIPGLMMSQITSPFLRGFESPDGSQVFMVKSSTRDSKPYSADYLSSITDMSVFAQVFQLAKPASMMVKNQSNGTRVLHISAIGNGDGKTLFQRRGIQTRFEGTYISVKFNNGKYSTLRVNFRGKTTSTEDYQQFLRYVDTLKIPPNVRPLLN